MGTHKATSFFVTVALYSIIHNCIYFTSLLFLSMEVSASRLLLQSL